jgi:diguanylate cyclase (GGDEF)-like protein
LPLVTTGALLTHGLVRPARALLALNAALLLAYVAVVAGVVDWPAAASLATPLGYLALLALSAVVCWVRAASVDRDRLAWICAGAAIALWAVGQVLADVVPASSAATAFSPVDACYLAFYPVMYATLSLLARTRSAGYSVTTWLDGLTGALSIGAVASALAFDPVVALTGGDAATITVNLAYPTGDVLLMGSALASLLVHGWRGDRATGLLAAAMAVAAVVDAFYLVDVAMGVFDDGGVLAAGWPLAALLIAAAAWHEPAEPRREVDDGSVRAQVPTGIFAALAVLVLILDNFHPVNALAGIVATAAMSVIIVRLALAGRQTRALERNRLLARTDDLTGLANRRAFYQEAEERIAEALGAARTVALLLIDLDRFKELNDTLGHAAGDDLLREFAGRLNRAMPGAALLSRLGGDEFVVLLPSGSDETQARRAARRLAEALDAPFALDGLRTNVRASVGAAVGPRHGSDRAELLRHADIAMYLSKTRKTELEVYVPEEDVHSRDRIELAGQLPDAIEQDQLVLFFQPKVELATGHVTGVEALVRWRHPDRGMLGPNEFLPLAEQHGLMRRLTLQVVRQALGQQAAWREEGIELQTAVNISVANLLDPAFPTDVAEVIARHGTPAGALVFELTEDTLMADPQRALDVLAQLGELGIGLALDDFGTGYSSLAHLKRLPVQELKIDRSFVLDMTRDAEDAVIVRSTVDLARNLGLRVVAEGVETAETYDQLAAYGCHAAQGYHLSRPLPAPALTRWLRRRGLVGTSGVATAARPGGR